jgi:hypothetical protein
MFYTVGFYKPAYGGLLVRAHSGAAALTKARQTGYTSNPGDLLFGCRKGRRSR